MPKPRLKQTIVSDVSYNRESDERARGEIASQINRYLEPRGLPVSFSYIMNRLNGKPDLRNLRRYNLDKPDGSEEQLQDYDNVGTMDDPNLGSSKDTILQYSPDAVTDVLHALIKSRDVFCLIDPKQMTEFPEHVKMLITVVSSELDDKYEYDGESEMMLISKENVASCLKFLKLRKNGGNSGTRYRDDAE